MSNSSCLMSFQDNKINGVTQNTRLLGSSYLFPFVIPDPHVTTATLQPDDQLVIIANQGLWKYMSYQETVNEILNIPDPVLAAKKLQDLAQGYNSQENIGVLVVRLMLSHGERNKMREMFHKQFEIEQKLLAELKVRDIDREEMRKRAELEEQNETVPMDIVKLKHGKKRKQVDGVFSDNVKGSDVGVAGIDDLDGVKIRPLPRENRHIDSADPTSNWEIMLQKRLTEEVKDKELIHAMRTHGEYDPYFPNVESDENWSTTTKLKGQVKERTVTLPPNETRNLPLPQSVPHRPTFSDDTQISTESLEFRRELKHPLNVDRDAILFHDMQLSRQKSHLISSRSIDSIQSDPAFASAKEMMNEKKSSSHSIEVLLHGPTAQHARHKSFGGSQKVPKQEIEISQRNSKGDSCPTDMTDRLKMLEEKGFLPHDTDHGEKPKVDKRLTAAEAESQYAEILNLSGGESTDTLDGNEEKTVSTDTLTDKNVGVSDNNDTFQDDTAGYETISGFSAKIKGAHDKSVEMENVNVSDNDSAIKQDSKEVKKVGYMQWLNESIGKKSNSAEMLPEKTVDEDENLTELYATVRKVRKVHNENVEQNNSETDIPAENGERIGDTEIPNKKITVNGASEANNSETPVVEMNGGINRKTPVLNNADTTIYSNTDYSKIPAVNSFHPSKSPVNKINTTNPEKSQPTVNTSPSPVTNILAKYETKVSSDNSSHSSYATPEQTEEVNRTGTHNSQEHKFPFKKRQAPKIDESRRSKSPVSYYQEKSNFVQQQKQKFLQNQGQTTTNSKEETRRSRSPVTYSDGVAYKKNGENQGHNRAMNNSPNMTKPVGKSSFTDQSKRSRSKSPVSFRGGNPLPDVVKHTNTQTSPSPYQGKTSVIDTGGDVSNVSAEHKKQAPPPIPPRVPLKQFSPQSDINSNSIKSLEDLIAYNRLQQQKVSYKVTPKVAPTPPPKVPETSMITKTASQRSVIITYL